MEDSVQLDTTSSSDRAQNDSKSETEQGDKAVLETPSSLETGSSPGENGQPQAPTKRNKVETVILMSTLCVRYSI